MGAGRINLWRIAQTELGTERSGDADNLREIVITPENALNMLLAGLYTSLQPFNPPNAIPRAIRSCATRNRSSIGIDEAIKAANSCTQSPL